MYLTDCLIENVGPIESLDLTLRFTEGGRPKPLVLVGPNGSGKTVLLAHVVDALIELAKVAYSDIVPGQQRFSSPYFKLLGGTNQRSGTHYGIGLLQFTHGPDKYGYIDKSGVLEPGTLAPKLRGRFSPVNTWPTQEAHKAALPQSNKTLEEIFLKGAICFFPSSRHERPHWINREGVTDTPIFDAEGRITGKLGKPIVVESATQENRRWILDVMLDSMVDFEVGPQYGFSVTPDGTEEPTSPAPIMITSNLRDKLLLKQSRRNVERLLRHVLQDESANLVVNYRTMPHRLSVARAGSGDIPSLDHLSAGQAVLFNLFTTVIRYADQADLHKSIRLEEIEGIVLVDEIDAHLHTDMQYQLLPKLLKLFPKVQFILTSHSPLFLLGLEREFGSGGLQVVEMPGGQPLLAERFSEFRTSFECYKRTRAFEDEVKEALAGAAKPLVLTEGDTDPIYITTALELLGRKDILANLEIRCVGQRGRDGSINAGVDGLNHTRNVAEAHPSLLRQSVLLLYDCDSRKPPEDIGPLSVRAIPKNEANTRIRKGIENLLPAELFEGRFYETSVKLGDYGEEKAISHFRKAAFCKWLCEERRNAADFQAFQAVVRILEEFLGRGKPGEA